VHFFQRGRHTEDRPYKKTKPLEKTHPRAALLIKGDVTQTSRLRLQECSAAMVDK
jgi:hypothetical protein